MTDQKRNAPIIVLRDGSLKASVWENDGENGKYLTTTFAKTYSNDGDPQDTQSFGKSDLLAISELARRAYTKAVLYYRNEPLVD